MSQPRECLSIPPIIIRNDFLDLRQSIAQGFGFGRETVVGSFWQIYVRQEPPPADGETQSRLTKKKSFSAGRGIKLKSAIKPKISIDFAISCRRESEIYVS
jgi:hypothetical protein